MSKSSSFSIVLIISLCFGFVGCVTVRNTTSKYLVPEPVSSVASQTKTEQAPELEITNSTATTKLLQNVRADMNTTSKSLAPEPVSSGASQTITEQASEFKFLNPEATEQLKALLERNFYKLDIYEFSDLIEDGADVNLINEKGCTPLKKASLVGNIEAVKLLLAAGADVDKADKDGSTPLIESSFKGHTEIVKLLLDAGADVNKVDSRSFSAIHYAVKYNQPEVVKLLQGLSKYSGHEEYIFTDNGDGTVTDNTTGLMWQQEDDGGRYSWGSACKNCMALSLAGYTDWRLPNIRELISLINNRNKAFPGIDETYFPNTNSFTYWSSTTNSTHPIFALGVRYFSGGTMPDHYTPKQDMVNHIRCVRGRQ